MRLAGQMTFSIQHPDLSSALVPPDDASTAEFRAVSCSINLSTPQKAAAPPRPTRQTRSRKRVKVEEVDSSQDGAGDDELYECLTADDRRAIDDFVSSLNFRTTGNHPTGPVQQGVTGAIEDILGSGNVQNLLQTALRILVLGSNRSYKGVKALESTPSQSLTVLMPAVFHVPYLKVCQRSPLSYSSLMLSADNI